MFSDVIGPVRMLSDAFGRNRMRLCWDAFGHFVEILIFIEILGVFLGHLGSGDVFFQGGERASGVLLQGAYF